MQKIKKIHREDLAENASQTYRQTDGQMNRTDFTGALQQSWRLNHTFLKFENKIWKQSMPEKGIQLTQFIVERVQKQ